MKVAQVTPAGTLTVVVATVALAAWIAAAGPFVRAWRAANRAESVHALDLSRHVTGLEAPKQLPERAKAHLAVCSEAFAIVFAAIVAALAVGVATARS